jgi:hypothetical protein
MYIYVCTLLYVNCKWYGLLRLRRGVLPVGEGGEMGIGQNRPVRGRMVLRWSLARFPDDRLSKTAGGWGMGHPEVSGTAAARQRATRADELLHDHGDEKLDAAVKHPACRQKGTMRTGKRQGEINDVWEQAAKPLGSRLNPTGEAHFGLLVSPTMLWSLPLTLS